MIDLKKMKVLIVILFLLITFDSGHIGGQFGCFLILGLISGGVTSIFSLIQIFTLIAFLKSSFKPSNKDVYIFLIGGILLLIPIVYHIIFLISERHYRQPFFYLTTSLFLIAYVYTLFNMRNKK
jgi:hypothetical protein